MFNTMGTDLVNLKADYIVFSYDVVECEILDETLWRNSCAARHYKGLDTYGVWAPN